MDSENLLIIKYYPEIRELTNATINVPCTEEGCPRTFTSEANMRQHIRKSHHKKMESVNPDEYIIRQYHCPVMECVYNKKNFFATLKYLKQHYIKVHAEKKFVCEKCQKKFPTKYLKTLHAQSCGNTYKCLECGNQYTCYESLLTHGRRKKHFIGNKEILHPWSVRKKNTSENNNDITRFKLISQTKLIPVAARPVAHDKGVQTDAQIEIKPKTKRRATRQTQTCSRKKTRKSAETQTSAAAASKSAAAPVKKLQDELNKICLETQDDCIMESNYFQEPSGKETGLVLKLESSDPNLGGLDSLNFIHSNLQSNNTNIFDCNTFTNCNTETQTDFIFANDLLSAETQTNHLIDLDMYTNMYTQTYDDFLLPDAYESLMTQSVLNLDINDREMNNTHTQTEIEYIQLLEEINA